MNQEKITQILSNIEKEDLEIVNYSYNDWIMFFFNKTIESPKIHWKERINRGKDFIKDEKFSEEDFKKAFPELSYEKYLSPKDFPIERVSMKKKQIIAFELSKEIELEHDKIVETLSHLYDMPARDWHYRMFIKFISLVDKEDHTRLKVKEAFKKVS